MKKLKVEFEIEVKESDFDTEIIKQNIEALLDLLQYTSKGLKIFSDESLKELEDYFKEMTKLPKPDRDIYKTPYPWPTPWQSPKTQPYKFGDPRSGPMFTCNGNNSSTKGQFKLTGDINITPSSNNNHKQ